jgi:hypothetical protein
MDSQQPTDMQVIEQCGQWSGGIARSATGVKAYNMHLTTAFLHCEQ